MEDYLKQKNFHVPLDYVRSRFSLWKKLDLEQIKQFNF
jgi:hypothetical protein